MSPPRPGAPAAAARSPAPVTVRVPAKINLYLGVGARRPDGYHELASVFHAVSLYDEVTVAPAGRLVLDVHGEAAGVPRNRDNLAARAVRAVARVGRVRGSVRLTLVKGIPVAGGMAGGSADAAAALLGAATMWGVELPPERFASIAADLGSDVPFLLLGRTALGHGRGELLAPVLSRGTLPWVLAIDDDGLSTGAVYAEIDRMRAVGAAASGPGPAAVLAALRSGDLAALGRALHNDLEPAALRLRPRLRRVLDVGRELGALGGLVSGSGPTCAFLARDPQDAARLAAALSGAGLCRTVRSVTGPVGGARVVG